MDNRIKQNKIIINRAGWVPGIDLHFLWLRHNRYPVDGCSGTPTHVAMALTLEIQVCNYWLKVQL